jgi:hypothetical protein
MSLEPPSQVPQESAQGSKWAVISIVCGALGLLTSACIVASPLSIVGIFAGVTHLRRERESRSMAIAGITLSALGFIAMIVFAVIYVQLAPGAYVRSMGGIPGDPGSGLDKSEVPFEFELTWTLQKNVIGIGIGDVTSDSVPEILLSVTDHRTSTIDAVDKDGHTILSIPGGAEFVEVGRGPDGPRIIIPENGARMLDLQGNSLWVYQNEYHLDDIRMGDIDGDGIDEVITGTNGSGGLRLLSHTGEVLWEDLAMGNCWSQAILDAHDGETARIFSSSSDLWITEYNTDGKIVGRIGGPDRRIAHFDVRRAGPKGKLQFISKGGFPGHYTAVAFDETGKVQWETPVANSTIFGAHRHYAHGDLSGDGEDDWVFKMDKNQLAAVTAGGVYLATVTTSSEISAFEVLPVPNDRGLVIVTDQDGTYAYRLKAGQPVNANSLSGSDQKS